MFGGFAPPQQSREEIRALEADAAFTVQGAITTVVLLYLSPFAIDLVGKIF
ncbi:mitochondrial outer membrane translocase complex, subunit Tom5 [Fusarium redolens]|uniref:Mitochondrial outer membrane translocase complex, subunit Tom5 n=1 Tax=Fusarium redolens TaxID=48865 RepID=A0A9P9HPY6_FUSRE|nr:mitochondrial outer membrane translocase complex, subunit Tom5 [Fusarium redolens]KAH7261331.1 mitochondrial outer membrane translocase complex, subunit Tom5 [Fusarium redolens]